jgi:glutamate synthase domain-containing protein 3
MTGGTVVILGPVGWNLGAGMTGGTAYVWDPRYQLTSRLNSPSVDAERPDEAHLDELRWIVERHHELTGSARAAALLAHWETTAEQIWVVAPKGRSRQLEGQAARVGAAT